MTKKRFDCVEMKHQAAREVQAELAGLTLDEQVEFFRQRTQELRDRQARLITEHEAQRKSA
jgi:hypothetical protein